MNKKTEYMSKKNRKYKKEPKGNFKTLKLNLKLKTDSMHLLAG